IKYLLSLEQRKIITCDQRMFLFIMLMDENLEIYDIYMRHPLHSDEEIAQEVDEFNKNHLIQENIRRKRVIKKTLKDILGIEDEMIIQYEVDYRNNILYRDKINVDACKDLSSNILKLAERITSLDEITDERFIVLVDIAKKMKDDIKPLNASVLTNALLKQYDLLGINVGTEQVLLYLLIRDEFFHLIDIYEEESRYQHIKLRALDELGFYSKNLIYIEKMMIERFYPSKKEANWMLLKSTS
ncbi:MAG: hypothetical protein K2I70_04595, partial [Bacilli bacterium]|nr:hypothetical protein [Bacilli bacterium]